MGGQGELELRVLLGTKASLGDSMCPSLVTSGPSSCLHLGRGLLRSQDLAWTLDRPELSFYPNLGGGAGGQSPGALWGYCWDCYEEEGEE